MRLSCGVGAAAALLLERDTLAQVALIVSTPTYFVNSPVIKMKKGVKKEKKEKKLLFSVISSTFLVYPVLFALM